MQVSELQQGVTVINHSSANSIVSARLSSGLGSKLPSPPRCCWIGPHEWSKGPRATLSVQGVRTGGGVKDGRNYHEAVAGALRKARRVVSWRGVSPAGGAVLC